MDLRNKGISMCNKISELSMMAFSFRKGTVLKHSAVPRKDNFFLKCVRHLIKINTNFANVGVNFL